MDLVLKFGTACITIYDVFGHLAELRQAVQAVSLPERLFAMVS